MKLLPVAITAVLAAAALALGSAGAVSAHEPVPAADEQCGAQGDQLTDENDDKACGIESEMNGQSGDQGDAQNGDTGAVGGVETFTIRSTTMMGTDNFSGQSGQHGETQDGQHGAQQDGEFEGDF
jgi:hypothetical protein